MQPQPEPFSLEWELQGLDAPIGAPNQVRPHITEKDINLPSSTRSTRTADESAKMSKPSASAADTAHSADKGDKAVRKESESKKRPAKACTEDTDKQGAPQRVDDADERPGKKLRTEDGESSAEELVEFKGSKMQLKTEPFEWYRTEEAQRALEEFGAYLDSATSPIQKLPEQHLHLIGLLAEENDKPIDQLVRALKSRLDSARSVVPADDEEEDVLPESALYQAVDAVADRVNYGLETEDMVKVFSEHPPRSLILPFALQIWCWEMRDVDSLPEALQTLIRDRRNARQGARGEALKVFTSLERFEREVLVLGRKKATALKAANPQLYKSAKPKPKADEAEKSAKKKTEEKQIAKEKALAPSSTADAASPSEPQKKRRGRPPKSATAGAVASTSKPKEAKKKGPKAVSKSTQEVVVVDDDEPSAGKKKDEDVAMQDLSQLDSARPLNSSPSAILTPGQKQGDANAKTGAEDQTPSGEAKQAKSLSKEEKEKQKEEKAKVKAQKLKEKEEKAKEKEEKAKEKEEKAKSKAKDERGKEKEKEEKAQILEQKRAEKEEKEREREEKRAQREAKNAEKERIEAQRRAEEEKKEKIKQKTANFMSGFFKKQASPKTETATPSEALKTDFEKYFFDCQIENIAPVNRFHKKLTTDPSSEVDSQPQKSSQDLLDEFHSSLSFPLRQRRSRPLKPRRGFHPDISVREVMHLVRESDVLGDVAAEKARQGLVKLSSRRKVPIKLLQFNTDRRPGWYGTWTRSTNIVGARTPFGQDSVQLNYSIDSDDEWEDEVEGEDLMEDEDMEDMDSEDDSEMDDWLEDDLHLEDLPEDNEEDDEKDMILDATPSMRPSKGKAPSLLSRKDRVRAALSKAGSKPLKAKGKNKKVLGRRFTARLVPYSAGPHWQKELGVATFDAFQPYQIEFLNHAYCGLNPFTFGTEVKGADASAIPSSKPACAVDSNVPATPSGAASSGKPGLALKSPFPEAHTATFVRAIHAAESFVKASKIVLVVYLHDKLKSEIDSKVTKKAVEVKLEEVAEKQKSKGYTIRPGFQKYI